MWRSSATSTVSQVLVPTPALLTLFCQGRTVRKLPFLALCLGEGRSLGDFLDSLRRAAEEEAGDREQLVLSHNTA